MDSGYFEAHFEGEGGSGEQEALRLSEEDEAEPMAVDSSSEIETDAETSVESMSAGEEEEEEQGEQQTAESTSDEGEGGKKNDYVSSATESDLESEEEEKQERPRATPAIDLSTTSSEEAKQMYFELLESFKEVESKTVSDERVEEILLDNIEKGEALMRKFDMSQGSSSAGLGRAATLLKLACEHTKKCATMLKERAEGRAGKDDVYKMEEFISALKKKNTDEEGNYSTAALAEDLSSEFFGATFSVQHLRTVSGLFESEDLRLPSEEEAARSQKEPKSRPTRKRGSEWVDDTATQAQIVNNNDVLALEEVEEGPDKLARNVVKSIKTAYRETGKPQPLLEAAKGETVPNVVNGLFGMAFALRDGRAALGSVPGTMAAAGRLGVANLALEPKKPVTKGNEGQDRKHYIASFSAKFLKDYLLKSGGKLPGMLDEGDGE